MATISLDPSFAPELVEFWGTKYKEVKEELESLKKASAVKAERAELAQELSQELSEEYTKLQGLIQVLQDESVKRQEGDKELREMIACARNEEAAMKEKLASVEKEKSDLLVRLTNSESNRSALSQQVQVFYSQAAALAAEADQLRRTAISEMFPPVSFVDETFEASVLLFDDAQAVIRALPPLANTNRLYFLPRPPSCMPLRVPACGQPGYWFYPSWVLTDDSHIQLIVEGRAGEWSYLGSYVSALFPGHEMKLSEWMTLDEQTKMAHCTRVASQNLPPGQTASYPAQLDVKRRYEVGEWSVPCYSLQCVGFNMALYHGLHAAAIHAMTSAGSTSPSSCSASGKRRRAENPPPPVDVSIEKSALNKKARSTPRSVLESPLSKDDKEG